MGQAYIDFAFANAARYRLMFAAGIPGHKADNDQFCDAAVHTFDRLTSAIAKVLGASPAEQERVQGAAFFAWSGVHGAIMLQIEGTFSSLRDDSAGRVALPPLEQLMPALLAHVAAGLGASDDSNASSADPVSPGVREDG